LEEDISNMKGSTRPFIYYQSFGYPALTQKESMVTSRKHVVPQQLLEIHPPHLHHAIQNKMENMEAPHHLLAPSTTTFFIVASI
jgi:hypothetical protein